MKLASKYLILLYLKYFFIVLVSLELFFIGIDFMQNFKRLPESANIKILYLFYNSLYALNFTIVLSVILAFIIIKIILVKTNQLVSFYSLGYSKRDILRPLFLTSLVITIFYILLNFTEFAYSKERAKSILKGQYTLNTKSDLFLKYYDTYIYFGRLYPVLKKAEDVKIFVTKDNDLIKIIKAKEAIFLNNRWKIEDAIVINKPQDITIDSKIEVQKKRNFYILDGFKPKIIDNVYEAKASFSIIDAIDAMKLLNTQNININKIKAILLSITIFPLFSPIVLIIIFYFTPISYRFFNILFFTSSSIFITLSIWGVLFSLSKLSISGVILPEFAIVLPISLLLLFSFFLYIKNR